MWVCTKPRTERDNRFFVNLDLCSRINLSQLGDRWFIEVMIEGESVPLASAESKEEADSVLNRLLDAIRRDEKALDLAAPAAPH